MNLFCDFTANEAAFADLMTLAHIPSEFNTSKVVLALNRRDHVHARAQRQQIYIVLLADRTTNEVWQYEIKS